MIVLNMQMSFIVGKRILFLLVSTASFGLLCLVLGLLGYCMLDFFAHEFARKFSSEILHVYTIIFSISILTGMIYIVSSIMIYRFKPIGYWITAAWSLTAIIVYLVFYGEAYYSVLRFYESPLCDILDTVVMPILLSLLIQFIISCLASKEVKTH